MDRPRFIIAIVNERLKFAYQCLVREKWCGAGINTIAVDLRGNKQAEIGDKSQK
jgi:hypothetical protein